MKREYRYSEESDVSEFYVTATDVKQYVFCPRVTYFTRVMKLDPIMGSQQEAGKKSHRILVNLESRRRRTLKTELPFVVKRKEFERKVASERIGARGIVDLLVHTEDDELIPVEFKMMSSNRGRVLQDHKYQLVFLALLVEDTKGKIVRRGAVHYLNDRVTAVFQLTQSIKRRTEKIVSEIRKMIAEERFPTKRKDCDNRTVGCGFADQCRSC
jgi:CRISPR-associated exonuclease Cas4